MFGCETRGVSLGEFNVLIPGGLALAWVGLKAFLIALVLTPITRDIFRAYNVVDRPGRRKVHAYPIPRVGGIPIAIAYVVSLVWFTDFGSLSPDYSSPVWKLVPGVVVIFITGLIDDFFNIRPLVKLGGQIVASLLVFITGVRIETIATISVPEWLSLPLTVFWLLLTTNALNLIDGLDGLCSGIGLVATLTLFTGACIQNNIPLAHATFPLAGALLGFLCFNFNPATVFLGDSGALLIGFLVGCFGMIWTSKTVTLLSVAVPLLILSIPLLDVSLAVVRRALKMQPIFGADRGHIHHRLLDRGLSPRHAVLVLYVTALTTAGLGLLLSHPMMGRYQFLVVIVFSVLVFAGIKQLRYAEFNVAKKMLFGGFQLTLAAKLRLEQISAALYKTRTEQEWWNALTTAAREAGWIRVSWIGIQPREQTLSDRVPEWRFEVNLVDGECIRLEGASSKPGEATVNLLEFAAAVNGSFAGLDRVPKHVVRS